MMAIAEPAVLGGSRDRRAFDPGPRFDGLAAWARVSDDAKPALAAVLLEYVVAELAFDRADGGAAERAAAAALDRLEAELVAYGHSAFPPGIFYGGPIPLPSRLGQVCRACGCSERDACIDAATGFACSWADADLCSHCVAAAGSEGGGGRSAATAGETAQTISAGDGLAGGDTPAGDAGSIPATPLPPLWGAT